MGWGITLNRTHVELWKRLAACWLVYVAVGLLLGWHLKPRLDEFLFVLLIPLAVAAPWAILSLAGAWLKLIMADALASNTAPGYPRLSRWRRVQWRGPLGS